VMLAATVLLDRFHRQVVVHRQRITKNRMERHDAWERIKAKRNKIAQEERQQELARTNKAAQKDLNRLLNRRQRSCGTKRQHPNMAAGYRHLARLAEKDSGAAEMCVYRCSYCNSWHVGHRQQKGAALWD